MAKLKAGDKAPEFSALDGEGKRHKLSDYRGQTLILYFYPKDLTPGCTQEACDFQTHLGKFSKAKTAILGVSKDSAESHQKFSKKHGLTFPLLVDEDLAITKAYGAWGEKSMYGKKFMGVIRSTFVIGPDGKLVSAEYKVKVADHVTDLLEAVQ